MVVTAQRLERGQDEVPTAGLPSGARPEVHAGKCSPFGLHAGPTLWGGSPPESSHKLAGRVDREASAGNTGLGGCVECP